MESTTHDEDMTDVNDVRSSNQVRKVDSQMLGLRLENPLAHEAEIEIRCFAAWSQEKFSD